MFQCDIFSPVLGVPFFPFNIFPPGATAVPRVPNFPTIGCERSMLRECSVIPDDADPNPTMTLTVRWRLGARALECRVPWVQ